MSSSAMAKRPNRPLVVRCVYEGTSRKVTFPSAVTCRLDSVRSRIGECFSLFASPFTLSYTDDDGEEFTVRNEHDLTDAIAYFVSGDDDDQGSSIRSGLGSTRNPQKIVLRLDVVVEYDGPSLSDTSSISGFSTSTGEDGAESVWSSAYTHSVHSGQFSERSQRLLPTAVELQHSEALLAGAIQDLNLSNTGTPSVFSDATIDGKAPSFRRDSRTSTSRQLPGPSSLPNRRASDETARQDPPLTGPDSAPAPSLLTHSELGHRWLKEQTSLVTSRRFGAPSINGSNRQQGSRDSDDSDEEEVVDLALLRDARGKFYYSYGSDVASFTSDAEVEAPQNVASGSRPPVHHFSAYRDVTASGSSADPGLSPFITDCSACGTQLDYLRYVCAICGEVQGSSEGNGLSEAASNSGFELCAGCIETHGIEHSKAMARAAQTRTPPKMELNHPFQEKIWGDREWKDVEYTEDSSCSICQRQLHRERFKCVSCSKFELCSFCYQKVGEIHPAHAFLVVNNTGSLKHVPSSPIPVMMMQSSRVAPISSVRHPGVFCHNCLQDIVGPRFHCAVCLSWDLCADCEGLAVPSDGSGHTADHIMMKIPLPLGSHEVEVVSRRARDRWLQQDASAVAAAAALRSNGDGRARSLSPTNETVYADPNGTRADVTGASPSTSRISRDLNHHMQCSQCQEWIIGTRFQCANCPSKPTGYSLCSNCEIRSYRWHDPKHVFFKLDAPVHFSIQSEEGLLPLLYKGKVGEVPSSVALDPRDPKAYLKHVVHRETLCDIHSDQIRGAWFRCAHCPAGFDVCEEAAQEDHHDSTHVFVVFKAKVDMGVFRQVAHLEEAQSEPLLKNPVYLSS
ncbi:hypothetical protein BD324DRAFT_617855 [Kockovaella imperatae]|uniref:ZZ-type domain-containing protein n=1 Tax=Kockovaella imperatae TaxID=4999 RepID=A0A1Y1ULP7_9TREE|nr:hypothetical protein BD324DRAFT_617855 [Kockovaella imperatae]ORX38912.1 hypothetical protein BD324DRAFT_617855 [Kockovaella imperatae]